MKAVKGVIKSLKERMKKNNQKEREIRKRELRNAKVRFPKHTKCIPIYSHSAHCCSHDLRIRTPFHITTTYFLHFMSNSFNSLASKLPKFALSQEVRVRLEFSNFQK